MCFLFEMWLLLLSVLRRNERCRRGQDGTIPICSADSKPWTSPAPTAWGNLEASRSQSLLWNFTPIVPFVKRPAAANLPVELKTTSLPLTSQGLRLPLEGMLSTKRTFRCIKEISHLSTKPPFLHIVERIVIIEVLQITKILCLNTSAHIPLQCSFADNEGGGPECHILNTRSIPSAPGRQSYALSGGPETQQVCRDSTDEVFLELCLRNRKKDFNM